MAKVTSKLQVTLPKSLAEQYGIEPGSDIEWQAAGEVIRVLPPSARRSGAARPDRLASFDAATARQRARQQGRAAARAGLVVAGGKAKAGAAKTRGWTREELYQRGSSR